MNRPLILLGGGGHCKSVADAALSAGFEIRGILDVPDAVGGQCMGIDIIGTDADIPKYVDECDFVITVGAIKRHDKRIELHSAVANAGGSFATIIASTAYISPFATVGAGTVVLHGSVVNSAARIGDGCIINTGAVIEHDTEVGNYCHVSTQAVINGGCRVGEATFIGSGAVVCNGITIAGDTVVGAGAVVNKDILTSGIYVGVPARLIKNG